MEKIFKKGIVPICLIAVLLVPLISACGKKAPPKSPVRESGEQVPKSFEKK